MPPKAADRARDVRLMGLIPGGPGGPGGGGGRLPRARGRRDAAGPAPPRGGGAVAMQRATSAAVPIVEAEPEAESVPGAMDEAVGDAARPPHEPSRSTSESSAKRARKE